MRKSRRTARRGGGFFNKLKGIFTRKKSKVVPAPVVVEEARFTPRSLAPIRAPEIRRNNIPFSPYIGEEHFEDAVRGNLRDITFAYYKLSGRTPDERTPFVTDNQWSELRLRFLTAIYGQTQFQTRGYPNLEELCQTLYGMSQKDFEKELQLYERLQFHPLEKPFVSASFFGRLLPEVLRTRRELERYASIVDCVNGSKTIRKSLMSDYCVMLTNDYDQYVRYLKMSESDPGGTIKFVEDSWIVLHPYYFSSFDHLKPFYESTHRFANSKFLLTYPCILDAFTRKGMAIISPRLGFVLQKEAPELWNQNYWLPKFDPRRPNYNEYSNERFNRNDFLGNSRKNPISNTNLALVRTNSPLVDAHRIVILTLQKYAAARRWLWTRDPVQCSEIYERNYMDPEIAVELLRPDIGFEGYEFDKDAFDEELLDNQRWTSGNVYFRSFDDVRLKTFLGVSDAALENPRFPWMVHTNKRRRMEVPVLPLPEDTAAREAVVTPFNIGSAIPYSSENETGEIVRNLSTRAGRASVLGRGRNRSPRLGR